MSQSSYCSLQPSNIEKRYVELVGYQDSVLDRKSIGDVSIV